jgi:hypothetical protein
MGRLILAKPFEKSVTEIMSVETSSVATRRAVLFCWLQNL